MKCALCQKLRCNLNQLTGMVVIGDPRIFTKFFSRIKAR